MAGNAGITLAHTIGGSLGNAASATDYYRVTCPPGTHHLESRVRDNAPVAAPRVYVLTFKGTKATNTTDAVDGNTAYSPVVLNASGSGVYHTFVGKTAAGAEKYSLQVHCLTDDDVELDPTSTPRVQNQ
jgi:hypothetical protein